MSAKRVMITGATGILGSFVLAEALRLGHRPIVLMRDTCERTARQRLAQVLSLTGSSHNPAEVELIRADIRQPFLGLDDRRLRELRHRLDAVIHCAASVSFEPAQSSLVWDTNVLGTRHVIEVVAHSGIPLYYVSTAYTGGARRGIAYEHELDTQQQFNNVYERTKVECEQLIRAGFDMGALLGAIFRPAIIVGASGTGRIVQFLNFYGFLRLIDSAASGRFPLHGCARLLMDPHCTKNLVPVDWAATALWRIVERAGPTAKVYHLTNADPPRQQDILDWANRRLDGHGRVEGVLIPPDNPSKLEKLALMQLRTYLNYMLYECQFDRTNTDAVLRGTLPMPRVRGEFFDLLLHYARERHWKKLFTENKETQWRESDPCVAAVC